MFKFWHFILHSPPLLGQFSGTGFGTVACLNCQSSRCQSTHHTPLKNVRPWVPYQSEPSMHYSEGEVVEVRFQNEGQAPYWAQGRISRYNSQNSDFLSRFPAHQSFGLLRVGSPGHSHSASTLQGRLDAFDFPDVSAKEGGC